METNNFPAFSDFFQRVNWRGLILVIVFLGLVIGLGALLGTGISPWIALIGLTPVVIILLLKPNWAFYVFVASLPLELVLTGDILSLPKILGFIALAAWLLSWIIKRPAIRWDAALTLMILFIIWGAISAEWTIDLNRTVQAISTYIFLATLYFLIVNEIHSLEDIDHLLTALAIGGIVLIASGLIQLVTGAYMDLPAERLSGLSSNSNLYVTWCVAVLPAFYVMASRNRFLLLVSIFSVAGLLLTALYSQSRGGLISLAGFLGTLLVFRISRLKALALFIVTGFLAWRFAPPEFWLRFTLISSNGVDRIRDIWPLAWKAFLQNPWLGNGLGTSGKLIDQLGFFPVAVGSVHSAPLAVAVDVGIIGLIIYLGFLWIPTYRLLRFIPSLEARKQRKLKNIAVIIIAGLVGFLLSWIKGGSMESSKILWLFLGLMSRILYMDNQPEQGSIKEAVGQSGLLVSSGQNAHS